MGNEKEVEVGRVWFLFLVFYKNCSCFLIFECILD